MSEADIPPEPPSPEPPRDENKAEHAKPRRSLRRVLWGATGIAVLAAVLALTEPLWSPPSLSPPPPPPVAGTAPPSNPFVDKRLDRLEQRLSALTHTAQSTPDNGGAVPDASSLETRLDALQTKLDELSQSAHAAQGQAADVGDLRQTTEKLAQSIADLNDRTNALADALAKRDRQTAAASALLLAEGNLRKTLSGDGPYQSELNAFTQAMTADPSLDNRFEPELGVLRDHAASGLATIATLRQRFSGIAGAIARAGNHPANDGGWLEQSWERVGSLVSIRPLGEQAGEGVGAMVGRAEARLSAGDLAGAVEALAELPPHAAGVANPWLKDARARLAADDALRTLDLKTIQHLAHAAPDEPAPEKPAAETKP